VKEVATYLKNEILVSADRFSARTKKNPLPFRIWQRVFRKIRLMIFFATRASESQPSTRCLDANDGWHDDERRGGDAFCA